MKKNNKIISTFIFILIASIISFLTAFYFNYNKNENKDSTIRASIECKSCTYDNPCPIAVINKKLSIYWTYCKNNEWNYHYKDDYLFKPFNKDKIDDGILL